MKNGKRLTLNQKKAVKSSGLDPKEWLRVNVSTDALTIINKTSGKTQVIRY